MKDDAARARTIELLELVGVPFAERRVDQYPHEFSGGMRQRGDDRDGDRQRPERPHRRRADDGARRDDPGADRRGASRRPRRETHAAIILITHDLGLDRGARRPRRRHVRGRGRRARRRLHDLRLPAAPVHDRAHEQPCARRRRQGAARADPRPAAEPDQPAARMRVPPALRRTRRAGRVCRTEIPELRGDRRAAHVTARRATSRKSSRACGRPSRAGRRGRR